MREFRRQGKEIQHFFPTRYFLPCIGVNARFASCSKESMRAVAQGLLVKGTYEEESPTFSSPDQDEQDGAGRSVSTPEVKYEK
jgi:hypothetical protein